MPGSHCGVWIVPFVCYREHSAPSKKSVSSKIEDHNLTQKDNLIVYLKQQQSYNKAGTIIRL